jgi:hypothetical protein
MLSEKMEELLKKIKKFYSDELHDELRTEIEKLKAENKRLRGFIEAGLSALPDDPNCHISRITFENALQEAEDES